MNAILETEIEEKTEFTFDELSPAARKRAIEKYAEGEPSYDWWENTYEDAANVGLKITEFDLQYRPWCKGKFDETEMTVARLIIRDHGADYDTFKAAIKFQSQTILMSDDDKCDPETGDKSEAFEEHCETFLKDVLEAYARMLQTDYEYLSSYEAAEETIKANDYTFDEDGNIV